MHCMIPDWFKNLDGWQKVFTLSKRWNCQVSCLYHSLKWIVTHFLWLQDFWFRRWGEEFLWSDANFKNKENKWNQTKDTKITDIINMNVFLNFVTTVFKRAKAVHASFWIGVGSHKEAFRWCLSKSKLIVYEESL